LPGSLPRFAGPEAAQKTDDRGILVLWLYRVAAVRAAFLTAFATGAAGGVSAAAGTSAAPGCPGADVVPSAGNLPTVRAATLCLINVERARSRLGALRTSGKLARAASAHTRDMVARRYFDHQGPHGPSFSQRLHRVRFAGAAGEDIAYQTATPTATARTIVADWMNSPPHRANILGGYELAGVGVVARSPLNPPQAGSTFTVDFGGGG
jgi:uncharacterized protein YkwD